MPQPVPVPNYPDTDSFPFLLHHSARAPLRRLLPFTLIVSIAIGMSVGIAVGVPANQVGFYIFKETLNGIIAGISAPLFLWLERALLSHWRKNPDDSRPLGTLLYSLAGALAGCLILPLQWALPTLIPIGPWLIFYVVGTAALFPIVAAMADYLQLQKQEHDRTKELFGKYVSETVARRILGERDRVTLTGELRHCTVLFSDIRGFTRMVKEQGPEEVVQTLNEYFTRMIDVIFQFDGTVNKFIGDGVIVLYGAPLGLGNEATRAVQTARQMYRALAAMNAERAARGKSPIHIGIGIDTGDVVVGNIGSARRLEYTAIGAAVNNAYYLGGMAPPDVVYITENACRELDGSVSLKPWQRVELKGGTGQLMIYTLDDSSGGA